MNLCGSIFAAVGLVVLIQINEGSAAGSKLPGKYAYNSDPNEKGIEKVLLEYGFEKEDLPNLNQFAAETTKEISMEGNTTVHIIHTSPNGTFLQNFVNGLEIDEPFIFLKADYVAKTVATIEMDKITFKRKLPKKSKSEMTEVLECREDGCTSILSAGKETVALQWKRIS